MSSIDWSDFLPKAISTFREAFLSTFSHNDQEKIKKKAFGRLPFEPCQFEILTFEQKRKTVLIMAHDKNLPDMSLNVRKDIKSLDESKFIRKYKINSDMLYMVKDILSDVEPPFKMVIILGESITLLKELFTPAEFAESFLLEARSELRSEQVNAIKRNAEGLKKSIAKVPEKEIREELFATTKKIDAALQEIKRVDEEINKVRKLVGLTKEVQDWKLLISDVDRLKGEHVPREIFESKLEGLSTKIEALEKIEKAYERLSSQQEKVLEQQSSFLNWIKYSAILVPTVVACVPIIETLVRHFLGNL